MAEYIEREALIRAVREEYMFILHGKPPYNGYPSYKGLRLKGAV